MIRVLMVAAAGLALAAFGTPSAHAEPCYDHRFGRYAACPGYDRDAGQLHPIVDAQRPAQGPEGVSAAPGSLRSSGTFRPQPNVPRDPGSIFKVLPCHNWHRCRVG